jgi:hypothetical protein
MAIYREGVVFYAATATADLTGKAFYFAAIDSSGNIVTCGAGGNGVGVIVEEATAGNAATIQMGGSIVKVKTVGNIVAGSRVQSDTSGLCESLQSGVALGVALTAAVAGDIIPVYMY